MARPSVSLYKLTLPPVIWVPHAGDVNRVGTPHVIVLSIDPLFTANRRRREQPQERRVVVSQAGVARAKCVEIEPARLHQVFRLGHWAMVERRFVGQGAVWNF